MLGKRVLQTVAVGVSYFQEPVQVMADIEFGLACAADPGYGLSVAVNA